MEILTIIELLNLSLQPTTAPKRIVFDNRVFTYDEDDKEYYIMEYPEDGECSSFLGYYIQEQLYLCDGYEYDSDFLLKEVEIIEK